MPDRTEEDGMATLAKAAYFFTILLKISTASAIWQHLSFQEGTTIRKILKNANSKSRKGKRKKKTKKMKKRGGGGGGKRRISHNPQYHLVIVFAVCCCVLYHTWAINQTSRCSQNSFPYLL